MSITPLSKLLIANNAIQLLKGKQLASFGETTTPGLAVSNVYDANRDATLKESPWSFALRRVSLLDITLPTVSQASTIPAWLTSTVYTPGQQISQGTYSLTGALVYYTCAVQHTSGVFATDLAAGNWIVCADQSILYTDDKMARVYALPTGFLRAYQISFGMTFQTENMLITNGSNVQIATPVILSDSASMRMKYVYQCDDPTLYTAEFAKALWTRLAYELSFYFTEGDKRRESLLKEYHTIWLPKAKNIDSAQGTPLGPDVYGWEQERLASGVGIFPPVPGAQTWTTVWS